MVSKELTKESTTSNNNSDDRICKETKTIVITGASQGLGQAMAYEFVRWEVAKYSLMKWKVCDHHSLAISLTYIPYLSLYPQLLSPPCAVPTKARFGQNVVVNYFPGCDDDAQNTVNKIIELGGNDAIAVAADCTKPDQIKTMFDRVVDHYGQVDGTLLVRSVCVKALNHP